MKHFLKHIRQSATLKLGVKAGLTLLAFWFVFRGINFAILRDMLQKQDRVFILVTMSLSTFQIIVCSFRWRMVLNALLENKAHLLNKIPALKIYYISTFFTCCLPGTVGGDVVRVWLTKSDGLPMSTTIHSVIIDRLTALMALGMMILVTLPLLAAIIGFNVMLAFAAIVVLGVVGLIFLINLDRLAERFKHIRVLSWIMYLVDSLRLMLKQPGVTVKSLLTALITHTSYCIGAYFLAQSFDIKLSLLQCIILLPPVWLATTIPISIGGWGIREAGIIFMLGLVGVPQAQALMLSIQLGVIAVLVSLPASVLWLLYRKNTAPIPLHEVNAVGSAQ